MPRLNQVGKPLRRIDALGKAVGATVYAADYSMPNMLHAKVFRSPVPSARIVKLDVSKARALPGVVCVMTGEDTHGAKLNTDLPGQTGRETRAGSDAPVLASDVVRYVGEPIALVAAETLAIAEQALKQIELEFEDLPGVYDPIEAMKPGAPILFAPDNVVARYKIRKGDLEAGMAQADVIVENTFKMPFVEHAYLEPDGGVAWVDEQGVINIRVCTQVIEHFRSIARALNVPQNRIRIRGTMVGGGFGSKEDITVEIFLAFLARETGRPVKLVYTREEAFAATSKRHPFTITHRTGVRKDGRITASQVSMVADSGAYPYLTPYVLLYATAMAAGPYKIDNLHVDSVAAATNQTFTSAFRGFGGPQAALGYEQQMDEIAKTLGLDPLAVRQVNYMKTGDTTATGQEVKTAAWLEETATRAVAALGEQAASTPTRKIGRGMASTFQSYGRIMWFHDTSQAWVGMEQDGTAVIRCGVPDIGAGQSNSICQIVAEILGVPLDQVTIYATDSAVTPLAGTSTATRQLYMSGNAVSLASNTIRARLLTRAAVKLGVRGDELEIANSRVSVLGDESRYIEHKDLVRLCASEGIGLSHLAQFNAPFTEGLDPETGQGDIWPDFTFGAQAVEVAVDTETGEIELLKSVACHDVGRAINPAAVHGQIAGGSHQGLGYALMEDFELQNGIIKTPSFAEYLIPTVLDFPTTQTIILESGTGVGPFGAKGIGEPALTPAAPAVANAVADALGVRIHQLPFTPKRVLAAMDAIRGATT
ncbi:MAG: xanthine dehydrogenase family protein molybdopterin-binding subunit [Candidatus Atribacteria bacterium]|nr:MAG: xanthine dehydrogenase family protein molybdopterin-binding subunit [Candidatus Atribacteria bacterium]